MCIYDKNWVDTNRQRKMSTRKGLNINLEMLNVNRDKLSPLKNITNNGT